MSTKSAFYGLDGIKVYRNITRTKMADEQILTELIPFAEKVFAPDPGLPAIIVVPDVSTMGSAEPFIMWLPIDDQVKGDISELLRDFQQHFRVSRIGMIQKGWATNFADLSYIPRLRPSEQPNRQYQYLLCLYRLGRRPLAASWNITTSEGKRILGEPSIQECESKFDINDTIMEPQQESKGA